MSVGQLKGHHRLSCDFSIHSCSLVLTFFICDLLNVFFTFAFPFRSLVLHTPFLGLRNDLYCVGWDVKPYSTNAIPVFSSTAVIPLLLPVSHFRSCFSMSSGQLVVRSHGWSIHVFRGDCRKTQTIGRFDSMI